MQQLHDLYGDVAGFKQNGDFAPATKAKMLNMLSDPQCSAQLKIELAAVIDAGKPLVQAMYVLEGDGPLVLQCYQEVNKVSSAFSVAYYPNVCAIAKALAARDPTKEQQVKSYASHCIQPAIDYFQAIFNGELSLLLSAFKTASLFCPSKVLDMQRQSDAIDALKAFPFLENDSTSLKGELPAYLSATADVSPVTGVLEWWRKHESSLPH